MPKNIDYGVHDAVLQTLRAKGMSDAAAKATADANSAEAYRVFGQALSAYGVTNAGAHEHALAALKTWAQALSA